MEPAYQCLFYRFGIGAVRLQKHPKKSVDNNNDDDDKTSESFHQELRKQLRLNEFQINSQACSMQIKYRCAQDITMQWILCAMWCCVCLCMQTVCSSFSSTEQIHTEPG